MRLRILGSAAAEGWPALFCSCPACQKARANGGKDLRRRTAYILDEDTLIDYGPDIYGQTLEFNLDLAKVKRLLITHSHTDHLTPRELSWRRKGFSACEGIMKIYANQASADRIIQCPTYDSLETIKSELHILEPGVKFQDEDLSIQTILADHAVSPEKPLNYILERDGKCIFIGNDSGWWSQESWEIIKQYQFDIVIIECTYGIRWPAQRAKHMGADVSVEVRDELKRLGCLKENALVAVNHFSHNCQNMHADFEQFFNPKGIMVGYDGMILER